MQLILAAVDGSKAAERAVKHVIGLHANGMALQVLLLNVQPEWAPPRSRDEKREGVREHLAARAGAAHSPASCSARSP